MLDRNGYARDEHGYLLPGHPGLPGAGHPTGVMRLSDMMRQMLTPDVCHTIIANLVELGEQGSLKALEILLDRTEGKAIQQITSDVEINVIHHMTGPKPLTEAMDRARLTEPSGDDHNEEDNATIVLDERSDDKDEWDW